MFAWLCYHELWNHLVWSTLCSEYLNEMICVHMFKAMNCPNKIRVKEFVVKFLCFQDKGFTCCVLCCRQLQSLFCIGVSFRAFDWIFLDHILPFDSVLQITEERVRTSIYLLHLNNKTNINLHTIIKTLLNLITCKLQLQLSRVFIWVCNSLLL